MIGWHHRLDGQEFEQAPGVGDGQGSWCAAVLGVAKSQTRLIRSATPHPFLMTSFPCNMSTHTINTTKAML